MSPPSLPALQARYEKFKQARDWGQFHTPQNIAQALSVEASELLELFLWHDNLPADRISDDAELQAAIESELADIVIYALSMASELDIDLLAAIEDKLDANEERYDAETAAEITDRLATWQRDTDS